MSGAFSPSVALTRFRSERGVQAIRVKAEERERAVVLGLGIERAALVLEDEQALGADDLDESLDLAAVEAAHEGLALAGTLVHVVGVVSGQLEPLAEARLVAVHGLADDREEARVRARPVR